MCNCCRLLERRPRKEKWKEERESKKGSCCHLFGESKMETAAIFSERGRWIIRQVNFTKGWSRIARRSSLARGSVV
jgi:hypothetical protein